MCKLISFVVPESPMAAMSRGIVSTKCMTHNWDFPLGAPIAQGDLCPLGRIEQATEDALAKIADYPQR